MFVEDRLAERPPGVGLDLASGEGRNAIWLASLGWEMTAVDFSPVAVEKGRQLSDSVDFVVADVLSWEPKPNLSTSGSRAFDLVLIAYLQLVSDRFESVVRRATGWLEPGGELFMIGHDVSNLDGGVGGPQSRELLWDLDLMLQWVSGLEVVEEAVVSRPVEVGGEVAYARDTLLRARAN
jgi:SAM-dependent methyltransferase